MQSLLIASCLRQLIKNLDFDQRSPTSALFFCWFLHNQYLSSGEGCSK